MTQRGQNGEPLETNALHELVQHGQQRVAPALVVANSDPLQLDQIRDMSQKAFARSIYVHLDTVT